MVSGDEDMTAVLSKLKKGREIRIGLEINRCTDLSEIVYRC